MVSPCERRSRFPPKAKRSPVRPLRPGLVCVTASRVGGTLCTHTLSYMYMYTLYPSFAACVLLSMQSHSLIPSLRWSMALEVYICNPHLVYMAATLRDPSCPAAQLPSCPAAQPPSCPAQVASCPLSPPLAVVRHFTHECLAVCRRSHMNVWPCAVVLACSTELVPRPPRGEKRREEKSPLLTRARYCHDGWGRGHGYVRMHPPQHRESDGDGYPEG